MVKNFFRHFVGSPFSGKVTNSNPAVSMYSLYSYIIYDMDAGTYNKTYIYIIHINYPQFVSSEL